MTRQERLKQMRQYWKRYILIPENLKRHREAHKIYSAKRRKTNRKEKQKENNKWWAEHPNSQSAQMKVYYAKKTGKIKKQKCYLCNAAMVHAHHEDYNKPLDIIWLCPICHQKYHLGLIAIK